MNAEWISEFEDEGYTFQGGWLAASRADRNLLLSRQGTSIILDNELVECLRQQELPKTLGIKLLQRGFSETEGIRDRGFSREPFPRYFIIDLTDKCNYDCIYCFRDDSKKRCEMKEKVFEDILHFIEAYCIQTNRRRICIQAWGGEPLLELERIIEIPRRLMEAGIHILLDVETNGALITDEIAKRLFDAGIRMGISLDGPKDIHEKQRRARNKQSSYDQTVEGLQNLQKYYGKNIGVITVVTKYNVHRVDDMIDNLVKLNLHVAKFNIVRDNRFACEQNLAPDTEEIRGFYGKLFRKVLACWEHGYEMHESTIDTRIANVLLADRSNCCESCGCTGGKSIFSFDMSGGIFPCEMTDFKEERIGSIYDEDAVSRLWGGRNDSVFAEKRTEEKCRECPWEFYCQGGCTSRVLCEGEHGIDRVACVVNSTLYPLIFELIVKRPELVDKLLA